MFFLKTSFKIGTLFIWLVILLKRKCNLSKETKPIAKYSRHCLFFVSQHLPYFWLTNIADLEEEMLLDYWMGFSELELSFFNKKLWIWIYSKTFKYFYGKDFRRIMPFLIVKFPTRQSRAFIKYTIIMAWYRTWLI